MVAFCVLPICFILGASNYLSSLAGTVIDPDLRIQYHAGLSSRLKYGQNQLFWAQLIHLYALHSCCGAYITASFQLRSRGDP